MRTFQLDKLVKDEVFDSMVELGQRVQYRILEGDEFIRKITEKIIEEAKEYQESGDPKKLEDYFGAMAAAVEAWGFGELRVGDRLISNPFMHRVFVETVTLPPEDEWYHYYAARPDRFPEIEG